MSGGHTNEDDAPRDARDKALDTLLTGADDDLQDALGAALNVNAGLAAIVGKVPRLGDNRAGMDGGARWGFVGAAAGMGGRSQGMEDEEHMRASYLVEGDPDAVFSTDELRPPPIIGEKGG
jgi:hypothetical protein